jgi:hypothetical protein
MMQQGEYNLRELLDGRNKALRSVAIARAIENEYIIKYVPHPELPKTWIAKRVARKDGKPMKSKKD